MLLIAAHPLNIIWITCHSKGQAPSLMLILGQTAVPGSTKNFARQPLHCRTCLHRETSATRDILETFYHRA